MWEDLGGPIMIPALSDSGGWPNWGLSGSLQYVTQDPAVSPKYKHCSTSLTHTRRQRSPAVAAADVKVRDNRTERATACEKQPVHL